MHLAMSVALEFLEAASADLDCRPQRAFDGDFRVSTLPFDRVLTQIQTATTQTLTKCAPEHSACWCRSAEWPQWVDSYRIINARMAGRVSQRIQTGFPSG